MHSDDIKLYAVSQDHTTRIHKRDDGRVFRQTESTQASKSRRRIETDHSELNVQYSNNYLEQEPLNSHMNVTQKKSTHKERSSFLKVRRSSEA